MSYETNTVLNVAQSFRDCLSLLESTVIAEISEEKVRKDIEAKRIQPEKKLVGSESRLFFEWHDLFVLAVMYKTENMPADWRKSVWHEWKTTSKNYYFFCETVSNEFECRPLNLELLISPYVSVNVGRAFDDLAPRMKLYANGLSRIEEQESRANGAAVFKGTRLPVLHIGQMYEDGESVKNLLEDFPSLTEDDVEFARLYFLAHPPTGRPRKDAGQSRNGKPVSR